MWLFCCCVAGAAVVHRRAVKRHRAACSVDGAMCNVMVSVYRVECTTRHMNARII
jgi:hypothetical protein